MEDINTLSLTRSQAGISVHRISMNDVSPHKKNSHTEHVIGYLLEGTLRVEHRVPIHVDAGSITLIPAGVPHRSLAAQSAELWFVGFCATCLQLDESQLLMAPFRRVRHGALPVVPIAKSRRRKMVRLFRELDGESKRGAAESAELSRCLLLLILGEIRRSSLSDSLVTQAGSLVSNALEFIQQQCLTPISLKDVAAAVHRSSAYVTTTIKNETGYTAGEWINAGRVSEAANRLAHTDDRLDDIAAHVGWQDKTHLIRQFRKIYGITPAAWRRQYRADHSRD